MGKHILNDNGYGEIYIETWLVQHGCRAIDGQDKLNGRGLIIQGPTFHATYSISDYSA